MSRRALICLAAVVLVLQSGCATTVAPPVPSQAVRDSFGVVAIAPAQYPPQSNFAISWRHKEGATGTQAALMAGGGGAATAAAAAVAAPIALPVIVLTGVLYTGIMTAREAIYTSKGIVPADTAAKIEAAINNAVAALDVQNTLAARLAAIVKSDPQVRLAAAGPAGPDKPAARPDYAQLRTAGVDTVIEVAITEIGFDGCIKYNRECRPPHVIHLFMRAQARLVSVADGVTLFEWPLEHKGGSHELTRWFADGGRLLGEELEQTYRALAENIYDQAFLITPIALPFISNAWERHCWLEPLDPRWRQVPGRRIDTLRPTLRWTTFPRELDRKELDPAVLRKIDNVTYDLRIWDVTADVRNRPYTERWRNRIIYERTGLASAEHTLEVPLAPDSHYFWSVRARFVVDGRPMAMRWASSGECFSEMRPVNLYSTYYAFDTPK